jgi:hypothetical protein
VKLPLKDTSPEIHGLDLADGIFPPAGNSGFRVLASESHHPGISVRVEPYIESAWEPRRSGRRRVGGAHFLTSLNSEEGSGGDRKSEAPKVAVKSGNADGAKGRQSDKADHGNMTRHRADYVHDN